MYICSQQGTNIIIMSFIHVSIQALLDRGTYLPLAYMQIHHLKYSPHYSIPRNCILTPQQTTHPENPPTHDINHYSHSIIDSTLFFFFFFFFLFSSRNLDILLYHHIPVILIQFAKPEQHSGNASHLVRSYLLDSSLGVL